MISDYSYFPEPNWMIKTGQYLHLLVFMSSKISWWRTHLGHASFAYIRKFDNLSHGYPFLYIELLNFNRAKMSKCHKNLLLTHGHTFACWREQNVGMSWQNLANDVSTNHFTCRLVKRYGPCTVINPILLTYLSTRALLDSYMNMNRTMTELLQNYYKPKYCFLCTSCPECPKDNIFSGRHHIHQGLDLDLREDTTSLKVICIFTGAHIIKAGKLKFFGTRPNWTVSYITYKKFHLPRPVFHLPDQIFTHIGER